MLMGLAIARSIEQRLVPKQLNPKAEIKVKAKIQSSLFQLSPNLLALKRIFLLPKLDKP